MTEIRTEMLTSAVVLIAMVCLQWLQATGRLGATVAVSNVVQRQSKAIKLDINAHIALAWPHPICGVPGVSINFAFCNIMWVCCQKGDAGLGQKPCTAKTWFR